jgi:hypothetical protein
VYKGLDIVTNKVTPDEMAQVPHHLIDILSPLDQFNIVDYRNLALAKVSAYFCRIHFFLLAVWFCLLSLSSAAFKTLFGVEFPSQAHKKQKHGCNPSFHAGDLFLITFQGRKSPKDLLLTLCAGKKPAFR